MPSQAEYWLSLDLSSQSGSLALHHWTEAELRLITEVELPDGGKHSESLLPSLQSALAAARLDLKQVDRYLTCTGPGSFTGLRIAFAGLKAFHLVNQVPIELLSGHEIRALNYLSTHPAVSEVWVQTQVARESFLRTQFRYEKGKAFRLQEALVTAAFSAPDEVAPLRARFLAEGLLRAQSRQTLQTWDEVATAVPEYFGSRNY